MLQAPGKSSYVNVIQYIHLTWSAQNHAAQEDSKQQMKVEVIYRNEGKSHTRRQRNFDWFYFVMLEDLPSARHNYDKTSAKETAKKPVHLMLGWSISV